jgi:hypothetical protein
VTTPITKKDRDVCPKCGWYAHGKYASPTECDPAAGDAASTLQAAVPEVPSTKLGYGRGVIAFEVDDKLHVSLNVNRHDRAFHLDDVWLLADLSHDDAVDLVRTITAWRGRQLDRRARAIAAKVIADARAAGYKIERSELRPMPVDVEAAVEAARKFLADRGEHDLPSHQATTRWFAEAIVKLHDQGPRTVVIDRPNEYDPPTEAELESARRRQSGAWLAKIEALQPGDACEFQYPNRAEWLRGTVVLNGGRLYWNVRDEAAGKLVTVDMERVRLPGGMRHATYVGIVEHLRGKTALIIDDPKLCTNPPSGLVPPGHVLAQFDEYGLTRGGVVLSRDWHAFPATSFHFDDEEPPPR